MPLGSGAPSQQIQAMLYMVAAACLFSIMVTSIRHVSVEVNSFIVVFFRNLFGIIIVAPIIARYGFGFLRTSVPRLYGWRTALGLGSMFLWFYGITVTPVAEAVALSFTAPLFVTIVAVLVLGEKVGLPRWLATIIGFVGTVLVLRPGFAEITPGHMMLIVSSILMGAAIVTIKMLSATEPPGRIVAYMVILFTPISFVPALYVWEWPSWNALFWLAVVGGAGTLAHIMFARALSRADASAVMPLDFLRLPLTAIIAYVAFSEIPDVFTFIGGAVIFVSSVYIAQRENRNARPNKKVAEATAGQD